ncbi:hypothetical protein M5K25_025583 [Dendrobium thyrsiflorum]|uniref:Uncharacterized protein n=1 Tax=Dendrobium thyrsiflorum TaxID=117978 RepID=A0ABD0U4K7_DENTH
MSKGEGPQVFALWKSNSYQIGISAPFLGPMAAKKVNALEERLDEKVENLKSEFEERILALEGKLSNLKEMMKMVIEFQTKTESSEARALLTGQRRRCLNLQTADIVIIYDQDPNLHNEEQAVARAHCIDQKREVEVIYMEAVVHNISSYQTEDKLRNGGSGDSEGDLADEVINAGCFDQRTTHEERRMTLETLLHDEERCQETVHDVPSLLEVNHMIVRSEEEVELFDQMDEELDWAAEMRKDNHIPLWLRAGSKELNVFIAKLYKRPSKNILGSVDDLEFDGVIIQKYSSYVEFDDEDGEDSDASSKEGNVYSLQEEDREK